MTKERNNLIVHKDIDNYGYIDAETKEWVIRPMFEYAYDFIEGGGIVKYEGRWGIISSDLKWILSPSLKEINYYSRQVKFWARFGNKWGVINIFGEWVIEPQFDDISVNLRSTIVDVGGLKGIYSADFKCVHKPEYDSIECEDVRFDMRSLSDYIIFSASKNGKSNRLVLKEQSDYSLNGEVEIVGTIHTSDSGSDYKLIKVDGKYGVVNKYRIIVPPKYERIISDFTGFHDLREAFWAKNGPGWHLYNGGISDYNREDYIRDKNNMPDVEMIPQGREWLSSHILSPKITTVEGKEIVFIRGCWSLKAESPRPYDCLDLSIKRGDNGLYGLTDKDGNWLAEPVYESIVGFINGISIVKQKDNKGNVKQGLIDKNGVLIAKPQYDWIYDPNDGMRVFEKSKKCGVMTEDGKVVAKNVFLGSGTDRLFQDGRLKVKQQKKDGGKFGYLGTDGQWAIEPKFDDAYTFKDGKAYGYINNQRINVDLDGNMLPPLPYNGELDWQSVPEYTYTGPKREIPEKFFGRPLVYIAFSKSAKSAIPGIAIAFCTDSDGDFETIVRVSDGSSAAKSALRREAVGLIYSQWGGFDQGITLNIWQTVDFNYHGTDSDMVIESVVNVLASYLVAKSQQPVGFDESLKGMLIFSEMGDRLDVLQVNDIYDVVPVDLTKEDYNTLAAYIKTNE